MQNIASGPMFEPALSRHFKSVSNKEGGHYNSYYIMSGMDALRVIFPEGQADEMNFCLFSTSGVHGSYTTIEEIESGLQKYGDNPGFRSGGDDWPDDWHGTELTVVIVQPRVCTMRHGTVRVRLADIPYLKKLRETSWQVVPKIGAAV